MRLLYNLAVEDTFYPKNRTHDENKLSAWKKKH